MHHAFQAKGHKALWVGVYFSQFSQLLLYLLPMVSAGLSIAV